MYRLALGETEPWGEGFWDVRAYVSPRDVFLWRGTLQKIDWQSPADAVLLVKAIGRRIADFDVRGVTVKDRGVDVVLTARDYLPPPVAKWPPGWDTAQDIAGFLFADAELRARFPNLSVGESHLLRLVGPPQSLDFWLAHEILWDHLIGPKDGLAQARGIYQGTADDGYNLKAWQKPKASFVSEKPKATTKVASIAPALWAIAALALAWIGIKAAG